MNRVLIISYSYSPHITPRALRWSAIAAYLSRQEVAIDVICSWDPGSPRFETRNGVRIHRIGSAVIEHLRRKFLGRTAFNIDTSQGQPPADMGNKGKSSGLRSELKRFAKLVHDVT